MWVQVWSKNFQDFPDMSKLQLDMSNYFSVFLVKVKIFLWTYIYYRGVNTSWWFESTLMQLGLSTRAVMTWKINKVHERDIFQANFWWQSEHGTSHNHHYSFCQAHSQRVEVFVQICWLIRSLVLWNAKKRTFTENGEKDISWKNDQPWLFCLNQFVRSSTPTQLDRIF